MADLALVSLTIVFFVLARGYVAACAGLIGRDGDAVSSAERRGELEAPAPPTTAALMVFPLATVDVADWVALAVAVLLLVYLVLALLRPERF